MENLNNHGGKFFDAYLWGRKLGIISFDDICDYLEECFDERGMK